MRHRGRLRWLPALAWMAFIFWGSSIPATGVGGAWSYLAHFTEFAVLAILLALAVRDLDPTRLFLLALAVSAAYAATDEIHQLFVPGRMGDVVDWAFDTLGAAAGAGAAAALIAHGSRRTRFDVRAGRRNPTGGPQDEGRA